MNAKTIRRRSIYTPKAVRQALAILRRIAEPTPRERAEERMRLAKLQWTAAAEAAQRRDPDADGLGKAAFEELNAAREELRLIDQPGEGSNA